MFYATDLWVYPGGENANIAERGGVFRLDGSSGLFKGSGACTIRFQPFPGRRWRLTELPDAGGVSCGGLNTSLSGLYGSAR